MRLTHPNTLTPVTTTTTSPACFECGRIRKSGKTSCCARGGSWFGNCGRADDKNATFEHTWYEGIRACNGRQSPVAVDQQLRDSLRNNNASSDDVSVGMSSKAVIVTAHILASTPAITSTPVPQPTNMPISPPANTIFNKSKSSASADISTKTSSHTPASSSANARESEKLLRVVTRIGIVLITVCWC